MERWTARSNLVISDIPGAYKYQANWSDWVLVIIAVCSVALITSGWISWKAAAKNPVEALRYE